MRYYYAITKVDEYGNTICIGVINTFAEMHIDNYIRIPNEDYSLLGKVWTGTSWIENPNFENEGNSYE